MDQPYLIFYVVEGFASYRREGPKLLFYVSADFGSIRREGNEAVVGVVSGGFL